ncbi:hypothetical protein [Paraflavitalea soli]|nr:hypothetical protein [Paraflavitalea soli]
MADAPGSDPFQEIEKRKRWFFECTLRGINMDTFRDVEEKKPGPNIDLTTEDMISMGFAGGRFDQLKNPGKVYLDSQEHVWTREERDQRTVFQGTLIGKVGDWLHFKKPVKTAERIAVLKKLYEDTGFSSVLDSPPALNRFERRNCLRDDLSFAMARLELCLEQPWLIPELYQLPQATIYSSRQWIENAEMFITGIEREWLESTGMSFSTNLRFNKVDTLAYEETFSTIIKESDQKNIAEFIQVSFLTKKEDGCNDKEYEVTIKSPQFDWHKIDQTPIAAHTGYWSKTYDLQEIYLNAANADMGLTLLMRSLYLYGSLPRTMKQEKILSWRNRKQYDPEKAMAFFSLLNRDHELKADPSLIDRLDNVQAKLMTWLHMYSANPYMAHPVYSRVNAEVYKQALLQFKFWIDEPFHAFDNYGDNPHKTEDLIDVGTGIVKGAIETIVTGKGTTPEGINKQREIQKKGEPYAEMEYWSENHYIMFASSEYLAGQLWEQEVFQPAKDFFPEDNEMGKKDGLKRKERGRVRALKWLNNKLMFGWTEFNSSGYYREHLYALLNLVDFALDDEVKRKAIIVTDLLFFDVLRFLHKSSMGACGGRSQFSSKLSGWDNALKDVIEIILGEKGIFGNASGEIACHFATSTYKLPAVLLEIARMPPDFSVDRTRVSIGFDESPKYGISYSKKDDSRFSLDQAYKHKLAKHSPALKTLNDAIAAAHDDGYGQKEEDTLFWWSQSAFFNKEIILHTFDCIKKFKLYKNKAFDSILTPLTSLILPMINRGAFATAGFIAGSIPAFPLGRLTATVTGALLPDLFGMELDETAADELSLFIEGSTRSRANIYTFRNKDVMLSSIQNFRPGQLNFQSNVNQATISTEINVFTTAGFPGFVLSEALGGLGGGLLLGAALPAIAPVSGAVGAYLGASLAGSVKYKNALGDHVDGPGWWTGYWALPMILQHENTAIIAYDFHFMQKRLTDCGSHAWFPKDAFDNHDQQRTSAYDDDNFPLFEISGKRGFWTFGKKIHKKDPLNPDLDEEAYIGVFSNQRPEWQDKDSDFHAAFIKENTEGALGGIRSKIDEILKEIEDKSTSENNVGSMERQLVENIVKGNVNQHPHDQDKEQWSAEVFKAVAPFVRFKCRLKELIDLYIDEINHLRTWANPFPEDYFAGKDWYAENKNIWIIQVGNKKEYGSYEHFKERVSSAKVTVDDLGDLECTYHIPKPDGSTQALSLVYDDKEFKLDGNTIETDFYPRFENAFVRGGLVEWGQREYVIQYNGKTLLHQFNDLANTERTENITFTKEDQEIIKALVIYCRTEDEPMGMNSLAQATVTIGCDILATDEIIAAGEVAKRTAHDAEWIFFDRPGQLATDMTIVIKHPPFDGDDDDPTWKMSFSLLALLGDRQLYPCTIEMPGVHFRDTFRTSFPIPFTVQLNRWQPWKQVTEKFSFVFWQVVRQSPAAGYFNYIDMIGLTSGNQPVQARLGTCTQQNPEWTPIAPGAPYILNSPDSFTGYSTNPGHLLLFAIHDAQLLSLWQLPEETAAGKTWTSMTLTTLPTLIFGIPDTSATPLPVALSPSSRVTVQDSVIKPGAAEVFICAADGEIYSHASWQAGNTDPWRKITTRTIFTPLAGAPFEVSGDFIFVLDGSKRLWAGTIDHSDWNITPDWKLISREGMFISSFTIAREKNIFKVLVNTLQGEIWSAAFLAVENDVTWEQVGGSIGFHVSPNASLAWVVPSPGHLDIFTTGPDGKVYTVFWDAQKEWESGHNWAVVDDYSHHFENKQDKKVVAVSRVSNQVEIYTAGDDGALWKTWWA